MTYDIIVLGAGPGGFDAATEAAEQGARVALVERDLLGGTCLNRGCIPTKLMLGATSAVEELAGQTKVKVASGEITVNFPGLQSRKDKLISATRKAMQQRLKTLGVDVFKGEGKILSPTSVEVTGVTETATLEGKNLIVAVGARPTSFPGLEPDGQCVVDSTGFLEQEEMPESLIVVGAGFIGLEMAQVAHRMGAKVHVVDALERVAALEDPDVSKALNSIFKRWKWDVRTGVKVASVGTENGKAVLRLEGEHKKGSEIVADKALLAVGRRPNTAGIGLEEIGAELIGPGFVQTDDTLQAVPGVYVVGDANGRIQLAHAASNQAHYVVRRILGKTDTPYAPGPVPSVLYGAPEVCRVGKMSEELKAEGKSCEISKAMLAANPIAQAHASTQGFVKVVWCEDRIAGVTAVGNDASRFVTAATMMVQEGMTREQVENVIYAHPTLDESLLLAVRAARTDG